MLQAATGYGATLKMLFDFMLNADPARLNPIGQYIRDTFNCFALSKQELIFDTLNLNKYVCDQNFLDLLFHSFELRCETLEENEDKNLINWQLFKVFSNVTRMKMDGTARFSLTKFISVIQETSIEYVEIGPMGSLNSSFFKSQMVNKRGEADFSN